jgi:peroxiredoxin Q/BCP
MVELRKRKAPPPPPAQVKKRTKTKAPATKPKPAEDATPSSAGPVPKVGDVVSLDGFGGEFETNDGTKTTLKALVDESESGVVLFTYPKASTPGCKSIYRSLKPLTTIISLSFDTRPFLTFHRVLLLTNTA